MAKVILLAEDDEDDQMLFSKALGEVCKPCQLSIASDGGRAITMLEEANPIPDVIVLDANMPVMTGIQCLETIRESKKLQGVKVVMLSTSSDSALIERSYQKGANLYISKPDSYHALKSAVRQILES